MMSASPSAMGMGPAQSPADQLPRGSACISSPNGEPSAKRALPSVFQPEESATPADKYVFQAHSQVTEYVEKYFRTLQSDDRFKTMATAEPRPQTEALVVPEADEAIQSWLGDKFPKAADTSLRLLQRNLLSVSGPLACLWDDILVNQERGQDQVPTEVVLETIQKSLVMLGHVNAMVSTRRRQVIMECAGDKGLDKLVKDCPLPTSGHMLFGNEFLKAVEKRTEERSTLNKAMAGWKRQPRRQESSRSSSSFVPRGGSQFFRGASWQRRDRMHTTTSANRMDSARYSPHSQQFVRRSHRGGHQWSKSRVPDSRSPTSARGSNPSLSQ